MTMRTLAILAGVAIGLGLPIFLFGLTICLLSLVDVTAQQLGVGTE